jgi:hypothetical protein
MQVSVTNQITAKDLNYMSRMRESKHKEVYIIILERIYSRIRRCSTVSMKNCIYDIPELVVGHPMFDVDKCTRFIVRHLVMNGFKVSRTAGFNRILDINWEPPTSINIINSTAKDNAYFIGQNPKFVPAMFNERSGYDKEVSHGEAEDQQILSFRKRPPQVGSVSSFGQTTISGKHVTFRPIDTFVTHNIMPRS